MLHPAAAERRVTPRIGYGRGGKARTLGPQCFVRLGSPAPPKRLPAYAVPRGGIAGDAAGRIYILSMDGADITKNVILPFSSPSGVRAHLVWRSGLGLSTSSCKPQWPSQARKTHDGSCGQIAQYVQAC